MNPSSPSPLDTLERHRGTVVLVLVGVVAALRLADLPDWWLNPDEGIYYSILTRDDLSGFWQEVTSNAHPPLYYLLLRALGLVTWDFFFFRAVSVLWALVALVGMWAVGRRLGGPGPLRGTAAGLVAALLFAFAPGAVELSQVMRPYTMQIALLVWALWFLLGYRASAKGGDLAGYVGLVCLALLVHYSSVLALGVFGLVVAVDGLEARDPAWRRLVLAHLAPAVLLVVLYLLHLRPLATSQLADEALDGWLGFYMIDAPADVWWSVLGFQHLAAHPWLRGPTALLTLAAIGLAVIRRERAVATLAGGALVVAVVAAGLGVYPFGSTRHSSWLFVFVVPAVGWVCALVLGWAGEGRFGPAAGVAVLLALGGPVGGLLGVDRAPWSPTDQVLRQSDLARMIGVLDPASGPDLVLMSAQTFYLLMPFYPAEREAAVFSADSTAFHFPFGRRRVLVSSGWDFRIGPGAFERASGGPASGEPPTGRTPPAASPTRAPASEPPGNLGDFLATAAQAFPALAPTERDRAVILVGGWRPAFVDELQTLSASEEGFIVGSRSVPGLIAFEVDVRTMLSALDGAAVADG